MMMRRAGLAAPLLMAGLLAACGGGSGDSGDFCALAKGDTSALSSLASGSTGFDGVRKDLDKLVKASPDEVKDDVRVLADTVTGIAQAFKDAGVSDEDFEALQSGDTSAMKDIDQAKFMAALEKMSESFDENALDEAYKNISTYAEEECGVTVPSLE